MMDEKLRTKRVIKELRGYLNLSPQQASDTEILAQTKGTFSRAIVELHLAKRDFKMAIYNALPKWLKPKR